MDRVSSLNKGGDTIMDEGVYNGIQKVEHSQANEIMFVEPVVA